MDNDNTNTDIPLRRPSFDDVATNKRFQKSPQLPEKESERIMINRKNSKPSSLNNSPMRDRTTSNPRLLPENMLIRETQQKEVQEAIEKIQKEEKAINRTRKNSGNILPQFALHKMKQEKKEVEQTVQPSNELSMMVHNNKI